MRIKIIQVCLATAFLFWSLPSLWSTQSLADVARAEAERRCLLDEQGIEEKIVDGALPREMTSGELSRDEAPPFAIRKKSSERGTDSSSRSRDALRKYRTELQKLDKSIQKEEQALASKRRRLEVARRAPPSPVRVGRLSTRNAAAEAMRRLEDEIRDGEDRLKQLGEERSNLYDEGKRAGFLPGELEGRSGYQP